MNNPLGVSPSKGNCYELRGPTEKVGDDLGGESRRKESKYGRSNPEVVGSISTEVKIFFLYLVWFPDSLY